MTMIDDDTDSQVIDESLDDTNDTEGVVATGDTDDSDGESPSAPQVDPRVQRLERRLATHGRRTAEAEANARQAQAALAQTQQQVEALRAQLQQVGQTVTAQEQKRTQDFLESLPPEQRALAEIELLKRQIAGTSQPRTQQQRRQAPPPQAQNTGEDPVAYAKRRSQEILDDIFDATGIELEGTEDGIDWTDERTFGTSAAAVARTLMKQAGGTVAKKRTTNDDDTEETPRTAAANRPLSAQAKPPVRRRGTPPTQDEYNAVFSKYDSSKGPKAMRKELEKLRG